MTNAAYAAFFVFDVSGSAGSGSIRSVSGVSDCWHTQIRVNLAATSKLNAQETRAEEESVPRHGQKRRERF
jgi:hypothetical protein